MAAPAATMGTSGTLMPLARKARAISHKPMPMATAMKMRKVALTVNNVATTRPPSSTPIAAATGRLRPEGAGLGASGSGLGRLGRSGSARCRAVRGG